MRKALSKLLTREVRVFIGSESLLESIDREGEVPSLRDAFVDGFAMLINEREGEAVPVEEIDL